MMIVEQGGSKEPYLIHKSLLVHNCLLVVHFLHTLTMNCFRNPMPLAYNHRRLAIYLFTEKFIPSWTTHAILLELKYWKLHNFEGDDFSDICTNEDGQRKDLKLNFGYHWNRGLKELKKWWFQWVGRCHANIETCARTGKPCFEVVESRDLEVLLSPKEMFASLACTCVCCFFFTREGSKGTTFWLYGQKPKLYAWKFES